MKLFLMPKDIKLYIQKFIQKHSTVTITLLFCYRYSFGGFGILMAFVIYQWKKISADKLAGAMKPLYNFSLNKWYFDELYAATFVAFTMGLSRLLFWFDAYIVDGIVNGSAAVTRFYFKIQRAL